MKLRIWGPLSTLGLCLAVAVFGLDQAHKWWMLNVFKIDAQQPVALTSFFDLILVWNQGVSYGLLKSHGQWPLIGLSLVVSAMLWVWLCRTTRPMAAAAFGLIIGGALGNAGDFPNQGHFVRRSLARCWP